MLSNPLDPQEIEKTLREYGYTADGPFIGKVEMYIDLLLRWNERISLTRVIQPRAIVRFHFGESLMVLSVADIQGGRLADVGSGAGFPGFPLAMAVPDLQVMLIEANAKKAAFLSEVCRRLEQDNVTVCHGRAESLAEGELFNFISTRAVGDQEGLLKWAEARLGDGGRMLLWIGELDARRVQAGAQWKWQDVIRIPGTRERLILIGTRPARTGEVS